MKFVVVTIRRNPSPGAAPMLYPGGYNAKAVHNSSGGPQLRDGGIGNGDNSEEMLIRVGNELADRLDESPDMRIANLPAADAWILVYANAKGLPEEVVTDSERIALIQAKQTAGIPLTSEDTDALDPDKPVRGVNRRTKDAAGFFDL